MKPRDMLFCANFAAGRLRQYGETEKADRLDRVIAKFNQGAATFETLSNATTEAWLIAKAHERGGLCEGAA